MTRILRLFFHLTLYISIGVLSTPHSFFSKCDLDQSFTISQSEWESCFAEEGASFPGIPAKYEELFQSIDGDHDQMISVKEYSQFQSSLLRASPNSLEEEEEDSGSDSEQRKTDTVTVRTKDGRKKEMSKEELLKEMEERGKGFRKTKADNFVKEESVEHADLTQLEKDNPSLVKMIRLGNTSFDILVRMNHTDGKLLRIQTLQDPDVLSAASRRPQRLTKEEEEDIYINHHKTHVLAGKGLMFYLELTVQRLNQTTEYYEVHLEYNTTKYVAPHIAMVRAIRKQANKQTGVALKVPPLPLRREKPVSSTPSLFLDEVRSLRHKLLHWKTLSKRDKTDVIVKIVAVVAVLGFVVCVSLFFFFSLQSSDAEDVNPSDNRPHKTKRE